MVNFNFYLGASVASWLLTIMVIAAEMIEPFKSFLKSIFGHHWIGKAVIITLVFIVFGFLLKGRSSIGNFPNEKVAWYSMIGSLAAIFLFYLVDFFV